MLCPKSVEKINNGRIPTRSMYYVRRYSQWNPIEKKRSTCHHGKISKRTTNTTYSLLSEIVDDSFETILIRNTFVMPNVY